jgi:membrane-bound lytic murein transglycosylase D
LQKLILYTKERLRNKRKHFLVAGAFLTLFLVLQPLYFYMNESSLSDGDFNSFYQNSGINIPADLNFAGDSVPLKDFAIRQNLIKEILANTYWQSHSLLIHKRAHKWFPVIEAILKKNNIPDDFKYIAVVESNLATNSISSKQAAGYWQIIEGTGRQYGLEINTEIDERNSIVKSTEAACKYFKEAYKKFNDWTLVAASYNLGIGGIEKQLKKQGAENYYQLLLNSETGKYIYRLLAAKEILSRPAAYGFTIKKRDLAGITPVHIIKVDSMIPSISEFAVKNGIDETILKIFNPWIISSTLSNPERKQYSIFIPNKDFLKYDFDENGFYYIKEVASEDSTFADTVKKIMDTTAISLVNKETLVVKK